MSSFTFPPPPPPAPVSATNNLCGSFGTTPHHGSKNGRGRGSYRGRSTYARGNNQAWGDYRRTFNNIQHNTAVAQYATSSGTESNQNQQPAYANELVSRHPASVTQAQAQTNACNWLYQSMHMYSQAPAFATQYQGLGNGTAPPPSPGTNTQWNSLSNSGSFDQPHRKPYNDVRGTKRKRGDFQPLRRGVQQYRQSPAQSRFGNTTQVAPAIPSFGFSLPTSVQGSATLTEERSAQPSTKKQKHNLLGLTPQLAENEDEEEEEYDGMDEEASGISPVAGLQFEHNGQIATLRTEKDIAAWIAERKKRYPTKARIAQKNAEALKRRQAVEEARERALKTTKSKNSETGNSKDASEEVRANKHLRKAEKLRERLKAAETKAAKAMNRNESNDILERRSDNMKSISLEESSIKEDIKRVEDENSSALIHQKVVNRPNLGLDYSSTSSSAPSSRESSPLSSSSSNISDSSSSVSVSASSLSSSSPLPTSDIDIVYPASSVHPEENDPSLPCNPENGLKVTKETKRDRTAIPQQPTNKRARPCKFFLKSGRCRNGEKCNFNHDIISRPKKRQSQRNRDQDQEQNRRRQPKQKRVREQSERKYITLSERLQMQEQREREQYLLQVIKDLGQRGILEPS